MASKSFAVILLLGLFGVYDVHGALTLTASTSSICGSASTNIPTGASVTLLCSGTTTPVATIAATAGNSLQAKIIFKLGGTAKFTLTGASGGDGTGIATDDAANFPDADLTSSIPSANALQVVIANAHSSTAGSWTCEVTADDTTGGAVVTADAASTALDLTTFCTSFTAGTYCGSGVQTLTCTTGALQLSAWSADATAQLNFRKGTTVKYALSASNINTGVTSGNLDGTNTGTWSASATTATMVTFTPASAIASGDYGSDWSCDITLATGAYNGASAAITINAACAAYTLSATCTGTTVSTLSIGTTGLDFATFAAGTAFTITVSKGTEERYKLTSDNVATTATTGSLDAASAPIVAGTYAVSATTATTWTFTPTAAIAEADEGSDWRVVVVAGANGGGSGSVSVTCGAEMNKMAGMLVALLVAVKTLLF